MFYSQLHCIFPVLDVRVKMNLRMVEKGKNVTLDKSSDMCEDAIE